MADNGRQPATHGTNSNGTANVGENGHGSVETTVGEDGHAE